VFDDENLVSCAGLVPVMGLAERAGLSELIDQRVTLDRLDSTRVASAVVNPAAKVTSIIAGMAAGAAAAARSHLVNLVRVRRRPT
jgi:hypothetical protein